MRLESTKMNPAPDKWITVTQIILRIKWMITMTFCVTKVQKVWMTKKLHFTEQKEIIMMNTTIKYMKSASKKWKNKILDCQTIKLYISDLISFNSLNLAWSMMLCNKEESIEEQFIEEWLEFRRMTIARSKDTQSKPAVNKCPDLSIKIYGNLVFGYLNQHFSADMPLDIMSLVFIYYHHKYQFRTDDQKSLSSPHYNSLIFINECMITKTLSDGWNTCMYGQRITNRQRDTFCVQVKWLKCGSERSNFFMGFYNRNLEIKSSKHDWKNHLGEFGNKSNSLGIYVGKGRRHFLLYDKNNRHETCGRSCMSAFDEGDTFSLLFDFMHSSVIVYHNNEKAGLLSLEDDETSVIPAFSLSSSGDLLRVLLF
eukprot:101155_1